MSPTYGYVTKLFLESEFQHKGNKQMKNKQKNKNKQTKKKKKLQKKKKKKKNSNSQRNLAVFLAGTVSENKII